MRQLPKIRLLFLISLFIGSLYGSGPAIAEQQAVYHIPPEKIASYILSKKGRKKIVVVWASSSVRSRMRMPYLIKLETQVPGSVIMISVDQNFQDLRNYMNHLGPLPFKMIVVKDTPGEDVDTAMRMIGAAPLLHSKYPTAIYFNEQDRVVHQGSLKLADLSNFFGIDLREEQSPPDPKPEE
ncbi:MAG: hypothetical protein KDI61_05140 [Alphaproteobacteria bacterium]|nr:hypothetical protein [Alphaproteobacteria bacterium]